MAKQLALLGVFAYLDDLLAALRAVKTKNLNIQTVYSPTPRHEIEEALGIKGLSPVRFFTLAGGILGVLTGIGLTVYTSLEWKIIVGAKPVIPAVPTVIVAFEFCILLAILFNLSGMLIKGRMPRLKLPADHDPRFSGDRFGLVVLCTETERAEAARILGEAGAEEIHEIGK